MMRKLELLTFCSRIVACQDQGQEEGAFTGEIIGPEPGTGPGIFQRGLILTHLSESLAALIMEAKEFGIIIAKGQGTIVSLDGRSEFA